MVLLLFAFLGGLVTILSPCILPLLPIVLSSGVTGGKKKPLGVVTGFVVSFSFFTVFLSLIVKLTGLNADGLRNTAALAILLFGLVLVVPTLNVWWERLTSRLASRQARGKQAQGDGFLSGLMVGVSLGLVWAPCVGPILASVITLAASGDVRVTTIPIVLAYSLGTAIPMLLIVKGSRKVIEVIPKLQQNLGKIQKGFGVLMVLTAIAIYFGFDRSFQVFILDKLPNYGAGLTQIEDNKIVQESIDKLTREEKVMKSKDLAPGFEGGGRWINSDQLRLEELRGKVVLVDFWTYSCVNCIRTLPYLREWYEKYEDKGFIIVGVHSPEFEFEKDYDNVVRAVESFDLEYPVVQDNEFKIWRAYANRYWPAKYLIDKEGVIRYTHFGEGKYQETEKMIQELLGEEMELVDRMEVSHQTRTPETYLGYWRWASFASNERVVKDKLTEYTSPDNLRANEWAFEGKWEVKEKHSEAKSGSKLMIRFEAKEVNLVMGSKTRNSEVKIKWEDEEKIVKVQEEKLYNLVKLDKPINEVLEIEFLDDEVQVFAFTFG